MASPIWLITVDFGSGAVDITAHCSRLDRERNAHHDLRPTVNTASFIVTDLATSNLFNAGGNDLPVVITKDGAAWFTGQVRPTYDTIMTSNMEEMRIQCVDDSIDLQKTIDDTFAWTSYKVCDTGNKSESIVHQLLVHSGLGLGDLSLTDIDVTLTRYSVERSEERVYWDELADLLFEYGFVLDMGYDGVFVMHDMHPTSLSPAAMIDADTAHFRRQRRERPRWEAARVTWHPVQTFTDVLVFSDRTGGDDQSAMNVALANGEYYPPGAGSDTIYSIYEVPDAEILDVTSEVLIWDKSGAVTLDTESFGIKKAEIVFLGGVGAGVLTRFDIRGTATVRDLTKINKEVVYRVADTDRILEYVTRFIQAVSDAQQLASDLSNFYNFAKFVYEFEIVTDALAADVMSEFTLTSVAQNSTIGIRIIALREDEWGNRFVTAEGITAYSLLSSDVQNVNPSAHVPAARDDQVLFTNAIGSQVRTPEISDIRLFMGMDPQGDQVAGIDLVEIASMVYNGARWYPIFQAARRAGTDILDLLVSGLTFSTGGLLSNIGKILRGVLSNFASGDGVLVALYGNDVVVIAGEDESVTRSIDFGESYGSLIATPLGASDVIGTGVFADDVFLLIAQNNNCIRSTNDGVGWGSTIATGLTAGLTSATNGTRVIATGTDGSPTMRISDNQGTTWSDPSDFSAVSGTPREMAYDPVHDTWMLITEAGAFYSDDNGDNWAAASGDVVGWDRNAIAVDNGVAIAINPTSYWRSVDGGLSWAKIADWAGGGFSSIGSLAAGDHTFLFASSGADGVWTSVDGGLTFQDTGYSGQTTDFGSVFNAPSILTYLPDKRRFVGGENITGLNFAYVLEWQEAGSGIVEQGSNANGEYVRFSNGMQICWARFTDTLAVSTVAFGGFRSALQVKTLPAAASEITTAVSSGNTTSAASCGAGLTSTTSITLILYAPGSLGSASRAYRYIAMMRWK